MMSARHRFLSGLTLLVALIAKPVQSVAPVSPPSPSPQAFKAAYDLVDALRVVPRLRNDCTFRMAVATEAATRLATSNFSERKVEDNQMYVGIIAAAVRPLITDKLIDTISSKIVEETAQNLALQFHEQRDIEAITSFFRTPAGEKLNTEFVRQSQLTTGSAGYLVYRALQPKEKGIQDAALAQYKLTKAGRPTQWSFECH